MSSRAKPAQLPRKNSAASEAVSGWILGQIFTGHTTTLFAASAYHDTNSTEEALRNQGL